MKITKSGVLGIVAAIVAYVLVKLALGAAFNTNSRVLTKADVLEETRGTTFADMYEALQQYFPEEAENLVSDAADIMNSGVTQKEATQQMLQKSSAIRIKFSPLIFNASDNALVDIMKFQANIYKTFADRPMICNRFLIEGATGLTQSELTELAGIPIFGNGTKLQFKAMAQGRDNPIERSAPTDDMYVLIGTLMVENGLPESYLDNFNSIDPNSPTLCETYISYFETIAHAEFDGADRMRAQTIMEILGS